MGNPASVTEPHRSQVNCAAPHVFMALASSFIHGASSILKKIINPQVCLCFFFCFFFQNCELLLNLKKPRVAQQALFHFSSLPGAEEGYFEWREEGGCQWDLWQGNSDVELVTVNAGDCHEQYDTTGDGRHNYRVCFSSAYNNPLLQRPEISSLSLEDDHIFVIDSDIITGVF